MGHSSWERLLLLATLWVRWCAIHSVLITPSVTASLRRRLGPASRFHRLGYNAIALVTLVPIVLYGERLASRAIPGISPLWL